MPSSTFPIDRLPLELLQAIFIQRSQADTECEGHSIPGRRRAPLTLSHVCRAWRELAIGTPELWSRLALFWSTFPFRAGPYQSPAPIGNLWLSRCTPSTQISLYIVSFMEPDRRNAPPEGIQFALKHIGRLHSLVLATTWNSGGDPNGTARFIRTIPQLPSPASKLRRLELRLTAGELFGHLVNSINLPNLKEHQTSVLYRGGARTGRFERSFLMRQTASLSHSITSLNIGVAIEEGNLKMIASTFTFLSTFHATIAIEDPSTHPPRRERIEFPSLRQLHLGLIPFEYYDSFDSVLALPFIFERIYTPNLTVLKINASPEEELGTDPTPAHYHIVNRLRNFLQQSQCSLQELSIKDWECDLALNGVDVLELASSIPTLKKLVYDGRLDDRKYLTDGLPDHQKSEGPEEHLLARMQGSEWEILPLLEHLECHVADEESLSQFEGLPGAGMIPREIRAIEKRLRSPSGKMKHCHVTVVPHSLSGPRKAIIDTLDSLSQLGLTHKMLEPKERAGDQL